MNTLILMQAFLVMHLTGLTLLAGTTAADYIVFRTFSNQLKTEGQRSENLLNLMSRLGVILGIGGGLLIFSGLGLMTITHGVFMHQLWFKIKLALIIMLVLNGFLVGNRQVKKLRKGLAENYANTQEFVEPAILRLNIFYLAQLGIFLIIIMLAVFKFN
nr:DUF2214 family protein [uncultured Pedobacter sp.]